MSGCKQSNTTITWVSSPVPRSLRILMKLRFVSHASFSVESGGVKILCDPWLFGKAFNQGWALVSPAAAVPWKEIDYIWISHQHPDHLHFPTLRSIPPPERNRITMLYQKHA